MKRLSAQTMAGLELVAERALLEGESYGAATAHTAALAHVRAFLDIYGTAIPPVTREMAARSAVLMAETELVRREAERQGVFEHLAAGAVVRRERDEAGEWHVEAEPSR